MSITRDVTLEILAFLFPPVCLACNRAEGNRTLRLCLCTRCHEKLETFSDRNACSPLAPATALDGLLSRWSYEPPFEAVIHGLKFGRLEYLGHDLAEGLHRSVREADVEIDMVVPIPLHWRRRLARGYNQAEAIAAPLAQRLALPMVNALRRRRFTRPQARLDRSERQANLRLAFAPERRRCATIEDGRLLLIDDVVTTGATLEAAAQCLKSNGAQSVVALTAGRTPDPGSLDRNWN
jgi:ComF family protein